jgi:hypothetical protein
MPLGKITGITLGYLGLQDTGSHCPRIFDMPEKFAFLKMKEEKGTFQYSEALPQYRICVLCTHKH